MATATPTPWYKKRQVLGLATIVLISGAIAAGVLGSRASKARSSAPASEAIQVQVSSASVHCAQKEEESACLF